MVMRLCMFKLVGDEANDMFNTVLHVRYYQYAHGTYCYALIMLIGRVLVLQFAQGRLYML